MFGTPCANSLSAHDNAALRRVQEPDPPASLTAATRRSRRPPPPPAPRWKGGTGTGKGRGARRQPTCGPARSGRQGNSARPSRIRWTCGVPFPHRSWPLSGSPLRRKARAMNSRQRQPGQGDGPDDRSDTGAPADSRTAPALCRTDLLLSARYLQPGARSPRKRPAAATATDDIVPKAHETATSPNSSFVDAVTAGAAGQPTRRPPPGNPPCSPLHSWTSDPPCGTPATLAGVLFWRDGHGTPQGKEAAVGNQSITRSRASPPPRSVR